MDFGRHHAHASTIGDRRVTTTLAASTWLMLAAVALAVGVVGELPPLVAVASTGVLAAVALAPLAIEAHDRAVLRGHANDLLRAGARVHRDSALLRWRKRELTSDGKRKTLARALKQVVSELEGRVLPGPVPLSRTARGHTALLRVEDFVTGGFAGPLYVCERSAELEPTVERCLAALDGASDFAASNGRVR